MQKSIMIKIMNSSAFVVFVLPVLTGLGVHAAAPEGRAFEDRFTHRQAPQFPIAYKVGLHKLIIIIFCVHDLQCRARGWVVCSSAGALFSRLLGVCRHAAGRR
jgi:hypothetical protein